jgi:hypothetical protein
VGSRLVRLRNVVDDSGIHSPFSFLVNNEAWLFQTLFTWVLCDGPVEITDKRANLIHPFASPFFLAQRDHFRAAGTGHFDEIVQLRESQFSGIIGTDERYYMIKEMSG